MSLKIEKQQFYLDVLRVWDYQIFDAMIKSDFLLEYSTAKVE